MENNDSEVILMVGGEKFTLNHNTDEDEDLINYLYCKK